MTAVPTCRRCGRELHDFHSIELGLGPTCLRKLLDDVIAETSDDDRGFASRDEIVEEAQGRG